MKRVMVFIDGNNFESAVNTLYGHIQPIDYSKLANYVAQTKCNGDLRRFYYYTARNQDPKTKEERDKSIKTANFVDALNKKPKCIARVGNLKEVGIDDSGNKIFIEKGTDVNIAVDLVTLAFANGYDEAVLFSADTDYESAINVVRQYGKNVILGIVDGQKAGYLKERCDEHFVLTKTELDAIKK